MHTLAMRRLTGNEPATSDFATEWPTYDLDGRTRALLSYATKLTEAPSQIEDTDIDALRAAGWGERGIWEATALTALSAASAPRSVLLPLPSASALVSRTPSVVPVIAVGGVPLRLVPFAGLTAAARSLGIVLRLRRTVSAGSVWWHGRIGSRIRVRCRQWRRRGSGECW